MPKEKAKRERKTGGRRSDRSIRAKIQANVIVLMVIALVVLGGVSIGMNVISTTQSLEESMGELAAIAAKGVEYRLMATRNVAQELGSVARCAKADGTLEEKQEIIDQRVATYGCVRGGIVGTDGKDIFTGEDFSGRAFYTKGLDGETYVSEPTMNTQSGQTEIFAGAPLWEGGIPGTNIVGVVYLVPQELYLDDIVRDVNVSKNGSAYIIDKQGNTIAHVNHDNVVSMENTTTDAKTDSKLKRLAGIEGRMMAGESGFENYTYGGKYKFLAYAPIENTDGWSIGVNAPVMDFMSSTVVGIVITLAVLILAILLAAFTARRLAAGIGGPVKQCADRLLLLSQGNLRAEVPVIQNEDETGVLAQSTAISVNGLKTLIDDISYVLDNMSQGNFNIHSRAAEAYIGDFTAILEAEKEINHKLSDTLSDIKESADQVSLGSGQLAESAQSLAEGATDQASSVEELLATVNSVTEQTVQNSEEAANTSKAAQRMQDDAQRSTDQMQQMTSAMARINEKSAQIQNIIQDIEEIATQTNLLSLNAAIEAARAGEAGRGFAVVAGEIGHLASQSAEAVVDTRRLIEDTITEVNEGNRIVNETNETLSAMVEGLRKIVQEVQEVGKASGQQAEMMQQLNQGIEQISNVIQSNSAAAQESSATSEELSAQATTLNGLVGQFTLRQS